MIIAPNDILLQEYDPFFGEDPFDEADYDITEGGE